MVARCVEPVGRLLQTPALYKTPRASTRIDRVRAGPLVTAVVIFLPTTTAPRTETCLAAGLSIGLAYMCYTSESLEARIEKAGYPRGLVAELRRRRSDETQRVVAPNRARREARLQRHNHV
jgi:hypothetical protein